MKVSYSKRSSLSIVLTANAAQLLASAYIQVGKSSPRAKEQVEYPRYRKSRASLLVAQKLQPLFDTGIVADRFLCLS